MSKKILVVGDVMSDEYIYVSQGQKAPENKSIFTRKEVYRETRFGGAGNTALNIRNLCDGCDRVYLAGSTFGESFKYEEQRINVLPSRRVPFKKVRYIDKDTNTILFRFDEDETISQDEITLTEEQIIKAIKNHKFDVVVVSDYNKGCITRRIVQELGSIPLRIVDSKRKDLRMFKGFDILKVNEDEYSAQVSMHKEYGYPFHYLFEAVVHTRGSKNTELSFLNKELSTKDKYITHNEAFEVEKIKCVDVTGCGDTHTAALCCSLLCDKDIRKAIKYANRMATMKAQQFGTGIPKGEKL
jgi:bifunctional ADP-heptose synthase (sugar kinase/adenylyltransferase)